MTTDYATSDDGVEWTWHGTALARARGSLGLPRQCGSRRCCLDRPTPIAFYDGRATAEENWEERTGLARVDEIGSFTAVGDRPDRRCPPRLGTGLRYVSAVGLPRAAPASTTR